MDGYCNPCQLKMESVFKEELGESLFCPHCGTTVAISFDKNLVTIESARQ
jgi:hypothetical protein